MAAQSVIIFDTEFTSWAGAQERGWTGPNEYRELVQIGAVRLNTQSLLIEDEFEILIKPARNPVLSDYFINLTGITQAALDDEGLHFVQAIAAFERFCQGADWVSYGGDSEVMIENMGLYNQPVPASWPKNREDNIAPWFHTHAPVTRGVNSGRLAEVLGVQAVEAEHTGLGDSRSIAIALRHLVQSRGAPKPFDWD